MVFEKWERAQSLGASKALLEVNHVRLSSQRSFLIWSTANNRGMVELFWQAFEKVFLITQFLNILS